MTTYKHPDGRFLTTPMPQFIMGDRWEGPIAELDSETLIELECPRCHGVFVFCLKWITRHLLFTRGCPYCCRFNVLPDKLIAKIPREDSFPRRQEHN
jgi:hypothetical protein